jgi:anti-anti-sigma factor
MEPPFRVAQVAVREDVCRITVFGDVDIATVGEMSAAITAAITDQRNRIVILDLEPVTFMSACGVGALVVGRMLAEQRQVVVHIERWSPAVVRVVALCGVCEELGAPVTV